MPGTVRYCGVLGVLGVCWVLQCTTGYREYWGYAGYSNVIQGTGSRRGMPGTVRYFQDTGSTRDMPGTAMYCGVLGVLGVCRVLQCTGGMPGTAQCTAGYWEYWGYAGYCIMYCGVHGSTGCMPGTVLQEIYIVYIVTALLNQSYLRYFKSQHKFKKITSLRKLQV